MYKSKKSLFINISIIVIICSILLLGSIALLSNSSVQQESTNNTVNASETSTSTYTSYTGGNGKGCNIYVYVYYDNTYISSCTIDAPYLFLAYDNTYPTHAWTGGFRLNLKPGYEWINETFNARFVWSVSSTPYDETNYGTKFQSYYENKSSMSTSHSNALSKATSLMNSGSAYMDVLKYTRYGNAFNTDSTIRKIVTRDSSSSYYYATVGICKITIDNSMIRPITYNLRFDYNGGVGYIDQTQVVYGDTIGILPTATKAPYTLSGWTINGTSVTSSTVWNYSKDQVAVAQWTFSGCTLTASVDGANGYITGAGSQYQIGDVVTATAVPYKGYKFDKWVYNGNDVVQNPISFNITTNSTLVAYFTTSSSVTANIIEGTGTIEYDVVNGTTNVLVTPTSGYVYNVQIDGISIPIEYYMANIWNAGSASEVTYFAKDSTNAFLLQFGYIYKPITVNISIGSRSDLKNPVLGGGTTISDVAIFANNGGEARITGIDGSEENAMVHLSALAYSGYTFTGWVASDGTDLSKYNMSADIPFSEIKGKIITANFVANPTQNNTNGNLNDNNSGVL